MSNWIKYLCEARKLILAWQAPDELRDRFRWAVGELVLQSTGVVFRYFSEGSEFSELNYDLSRSRKFDDLLALGYRGYPAFNWKRQIHTEGVMDAFMRRLPPKSRTDFDKYKENFRIHPSVQLSDFTMLGVTEAKLPSDGFSFVNPLSPTDSLCDLLLEVAGFRYYFKVLRDEISVNDRVSFEADDQNSYDPNAVSVFWKNSIIGYVNRLQARSFRYWIQNRSIHGSIERLNGASDHPRAYAFVRIRPINDQSNEFE